MAATLALSAESFVGRAEMVTGSYEISTGAYVETLHGARTVPTAEGARATNPRGGKRVTLLPPDTERCQMACIGQEVSRELELGHGCSVYG